jgi:hypothetical protein
LNQKQVLAKYLELGIVVEGHIDFGNGFHGNSYVNPAALFRDWTQVVPDVESLCGKVGSTLARDIQVVAGPETGGAKVAAFSVIAFDQQLEQGDPRNDEADLRQYRQGQESRSGRRRAQYRQDLVCLRRGNQASRRRGHLGTMPD